MRTTDTTFLSLMVQRLLDSEVLGETEGVTLRAEAEAANQCVLEGNGSAARRHVEQVALFTEALVSTEALVLADGRAVIDAAHRILDQDAD